MTNVKKAAEQLRITGKNYDSVVRQLVEKYHAGNGWAVVRTIDRIITMDVYVERSGSHSSEEVVVVKEDDKPETPRKVTPKVSKVTKEVEK